MGMTERHTGRASFGGSSSRKRARKLGALAKAGQSSGSRLLRSSFSSAAGSRDCTCSARSAAARWLSTAMELPAQRRTRQARTRERVRWIKCIAALKTIHNSSSSAFTYDSKAADDLRRDYNRTFFGFAPHHAASHHPAPARPALPRLCPDDATDSGCAGLGSDRKSVV